MSIHVYTGVPGTGKSLHAARDVRWALTARTPRPVIANFELAGDAPISDDQRANYTYIANEDMSAGKICKIADDWWANSGFQFVEDGVLLVLDEVQLVFNARNWNDRRRMQYLEFLSQSRKYGVKVLLIAQSVKMIDNQFRLLIEVEHNHRRLSSIGPLGTLLAAPFGGRVFYVVRTLYQVNERLGGDFFIGAAPDMAMYDSYNRFQRDR